MMNYPDVPIWEKYTLTIEEAAVISVLGKRNSESWRRKTRTQAGSL